MELGHRCPRCASTKYRRIPHWPNKGEIKFLSQCKACSMTWFLDQPIIEKKEAYWYS